MRATTRTFIMKVISFLVALSTLLSSVQWAGMEAHAQQYDIKKVTLSLDSNETNRSVIDLYLLNSVYYIKISDLCELTRCNSTTEGDQIIVTHGFWKVTFDAREQEFSDYWQNVSLTILEVGNQEYAVPAIVFLRYFGAISAITEEKMFCRMPAFTAWEALDVDFERTYVDINQVYGGKGYVKGHLIIARLMDFILGDDITNDAYRQEAFTLASQVDYNNYQAVNDYLQGNIQKIYDDIHSDSCLESCEEFLDAMSIAELPVQWYINYFFHETGKSIVKEAAAAANSKEAKRLGEKLYQLMLDQEKAQSAASEFFDNLDYILIGVSAAVETAQIVRYQEATDYLVYDVLGTENLAYLGAAESANSWNTCADHFRNTLGVYATQLRSEAIKFFQNRAIFEISGGMGVYSAASIAGIASFSTFLPYWKLSLSVARIIAKTGPITHGTVQESKADRNALFLSKMQQNVVIVLNAARKQLNNQANSEELYLRYIKALQLYCRTSIAMYENLITSKRPTSKKERLTEFQNRIDILAVSLYQLTSILDDGAGFCVPLDLHSFGEDFGIHSDSSHAPEPQNAEYHSSEDAYEEVLNQYRAAAEVDSQEYLTHSEQYEQMYPLVNQKYMLQYQEPYHESYWEPGYDEPYVLLYAYYDVDHNGTDELLIGVGDHEAVIIDLFGFDGTGARMMVPDHPGIRDEFRMSIQDNGTIFIGYAYDERFYRISDDGYTLTDEPTGTWDDTAWIAPEWNILAEDKVPEGVNDSPEHLEEIITSFVNGGNRIRESELLEALGTPSSRYRGGLVEPSERIVWERSYGTVRCDSDGAGTCYNLSVLYSDTTPVFGVYYGQSFDEACSIFDRRFAGYGTDPWTIDPDSGVWAANWFNQNDDNFLIQPERQEQTVISFLFFVNENSNWALKLSEDETWHRKADPFTMEVSGLLDTDVNEAAAILHGTYDCEAGDIEEAIYTADGTLGVSTFSVKGAFLENLGTHFDRPLNDDIGGITVSDRMYTILGIQCGMEMDYAISVLDALKKPVYTPEEQMTIEYYGQRVSYMCFLRDYPGLVVMVERDNDDCVKSITLMYKSLMFD